ncbi:hypothetical protein AAF712_004436 [Marasmius tenuissimus]|uniref:Uncharacterized protein n=1 Tax=Marasmius tenuissimus TaxID=585030 RepID=A0ABR3A5U0_9AGAR
MLATSQCRRLFGLLHTSLTRIQRQPVVTEEDEECKFVPLVMLKCIRGSEHEIGDVIVRMPGPEEAQAILTFEKANYPDECLTFYKPLTPRKTRTKSNTKPLVEVDIVTTYRLPRPGSWSPGDLVELLEMGTKGNNTEKIFPHPHIPDRKSTRCAHVYSIDYDSENSPSLVDFAAVLSLVSSYRKNHDGNGEASLSLANTYSFFIAAVFKLMHVHFGGSEVKMNEDVYPLESSNSNSLEPLPLSSTDACVSNNAHLKWHGITHPPSWLSWLGLSPGMDKFQISGH